MPGMLDADLAVRSAATACRTRSAWLAGGLGGFLMSTAQPM
jgi:hypothetical protein